MVPGRSHGDEARDGPVPPRRLRLSKGAGGHKRNGAVCRLPGVAEQCSLPDRCPLVSARRALRGRCLGGARRSAGAPKRAGRSTLADQPSERQRTVAGPRRAREEDEEPHEADPGPGTARGQRFAAGAETGLRRVVQTAALFLWIPFGFVFWLPFLLRRTVAYVFAVLYAGLTGGDTERAERRWEQAVGFYQFGFRRIVHAFGPEDTSPEPPGREGREAEDGLRRFLMEVVWAAAVWGAILWLVGIWPDAPEAVRSGTLALWDLIAEAGRRIVGWFEGLPRL